MKGLGGTPKCYSVKNSLMLDATLGQYLARTFGAAGSATTMTYSAWCKLGRLDKEFVFFSAENSTNRDELKLTTANVLTFRREGTIVLSTARVFRDVAAHLHVVFVVATTHATASERYRLYINDERVTAFTAATYPAQGDQLQHFNRAIEHRIGAEANAAGTQHSDGYFSEVNFVDGLALEPSAFGYYCPVSGQWQPKKYRGSYGANGAYLEFLNAAALGADTSGNGNNWSVNGGIVAANQTADTPTNNHCVLNPLDKYYPNGGTLAEGNLKFTGSATTTFGAIGSFPISSGKWYYEAAIIAQGGAKNYVGIALSSVVAYQADGKKLSAGVESAYGAPWTTGDVIGVAVNCAAQEIEFFKNGVSQGAFNYSANGQGDYFPAMSDGYTTYALSCCCNFGQRPFAYAPPAGFKSLCTTNLPRPAQRPKNVFAAVAALGSSIESSLAAKRAGWQDYIEIFKDRSNLQSWKWRFSGDLANMLSSDSQAGKAAFTTPTAADNYVGYALRVGAGYGVFTAEVAHVNGTPTNVAHGLGTNRIMAIGKIVNTTGDWYAWHPELVANQYLLLNSTAAAAAGPKITVDATNVIIAASLPSGTYRVIAIAETSGCIKLWKYTANGNADGPFSALGLLARAAMVKAIGIMQPWGMIDTARDTYNPRTRELQVNASTAELDYGAYPLDILSNGLKPRYVGDEYNTNGQVYVGLAFAEALLKDANAR